MVTFTSVLALLATLATTFTHVSAETQEHLAHPFDFHPSMIPEKCRSPCSHLANSFTSGDCPDLDCICDPNTAKDIITCLECGDEVVGAGLAKSWYNYYSYTCELAGKTVPSYTASAKDNDSSDA